MPMKDQTVKPDKQKKNKGKDHLWKPGQSGNPKGRPKGAREVKTAMLSSFYDFEYKGEIGKQAFLKWGKDNPSQFYKIISSILPKDLDVDGKMDLGMAALEGLSDDMLLKIAGVVKGE